MTPDEERNERVLRLLRWWLLIALVSTGLMVGVTVALW